MNPLIDGKVFFRSYPVSLTETSSFERLRGPGRYDWCAGNALLTLQSGGKVWVKIDESISEEVFTEFILSASPVNHYKRLTGYESQLSEENSGLHTERFFGGYSFSQTVGLWLEKGMGESSQLLSPFISTEGFTFSPEEYLELLDRLKVAVRRYDRLPAVSNGLEDLNTGFFRHRSLEESKAFITDHLTKYIRRGTKLHRAFLLAINRHARTGAADRRGELRARSLRLEEIRAELSASDQMSGRARKKAVGELVVKWQAYLAQYQVERKDKKGGFDPGNLRAAIESEEASVAAGFPLVSRELKTEGMSLNELTVNPRYGEAAELKRLQDTLSDLLREVDEAGLYQLPLRQTDAATTPRQMQQLVKLLDKLRNTQHHLWELPNFYDRRQFWYAQPAHLRRLLAPLLDLPHEDWEPAFSGWYFERCLEREHRPERFFKPADTNLVDTTVVTAGKPGLTKNLSFLPPAAAWPETCGPGDLLIDLTGGPEPSSELKAPHLTATSLSDGAAVHLALSGYRNPALVFSQSFQPLHPPAWKVRPVTSSPGGKQRGILLQAEKGKPWHSLAEWDGSAEDQLNVFFPENFAAGDEELLLGKWESLIIAARNITFFHALSPNGITQGLLSDGFNAAFLRSVLLRAAEAAEMEPFDREALVALGRELRVRCGLPEPDPHPLAVQLGGLLLRELPDHFQQHHVPWRDTFLPLVIQSPAGKKSVLLPDGRLPGLADEVTEAARQRELVTAGFRVININALNVWEDLKTELARIVKEGKE